MPTTAPPPPSAAAVDQSLKRSDSETEPELDDDDEYEEIEVEEEIEEEIEVEEEVSEEVEEMEEEEEEEDEEEEFREDLSPIDEDHGKDDSQVMESTGREEHSRSCASTQEKSVTNLQADTHVAEGIRDNPEISDPCETRQYEELHFNGKGTHIDDVGVQYDSKAPLCDSGIMHAETSNAFRASGKEVTAAVSVIDGVKEVANGILCSEEETKRMGMHYGNDIKQMEPRTDVAPIRPRSLSPGVEIKEGNKRPAVICDFFAKGWCIKGNSCRFLHVRDHNDVTSQQQEGFVAAAKQKSEFQAGEGLRDSTGRSGLAGLPDAATSAVATSTFPSERIPPWEFVESQRWKSESEELHSHKENSRTTSSFKDADKGISPINTESSFHGTFSSSPVMSSGIYRSNKVSSYATNLEELDGKKNQFGLDDRNIPLFSRSLNSSSSTSQPSTGILPLNHISAWTRSSSSFSSSSWNSDLCGTLKHLDGDRDFFGSRSASFQRSSSPFAGSESEHLSRTKCSSNDWEPSKPFLSSFLIAQNLSSPASQYDPIRDSIEQPNLGDGFSRFSYSSQGTSILSSHLLGNVNPVLTGTFGLEYSSDKHSLATHKNFDDNTVDKNSYGKDSFTSKTETVGIAVAELEDKIISAKEDKFRNPAHARGVMQSSEVLVDHDFMLQKDGARHKEMKGDGARPKSEVDFDFKADGDLQRESKALKHFRAALIEFVKELVKPTWREGLLSKDAHKLIVKKAVDKVLVTLPPHQIPGSPESVEMYLSLSQPKIAKLVEGYVEKYGKS